MNERVRKNLAAGISRVKWVAGYVADRTKAETSVARMFFESSKLERKKGEIYREIGERVVELKEKGGTDEIDVFNDAVVLQAFNEIKKLRETQDTSKKRAEDINKVS
jgi:hypothetical protein